MHIRPMTIEDYDFVMNMMRGTSDVTFRDADSREATARYLQRNPNLSFVALVGAHIVGCCMCGHDGRRGYLQHLVVQSAYRCQGIGSELVKHCLDALEHEGIFKTHINVQISNPSAFDYWLKQGWINREDIYWMSMNRSQSANA